MAFVCCCGFAEPFNLLGGAIGGLSSWTDLSLSLAAPLRAVAVADILTRCSKGWLSVIPADCAQFRKNASHFWRISLSCLTCAAKASLNCVLLARLMSTAARIGPYCTL